LDTVLNLIALFQPKGTPRFCRPSYNSILKTLRLYKVAKAGIAAIIQSGGSIRDQEVIDAANEHGIAMVFTGVRLFLH